MCKLCETKPVYEFTNQRKLCKNCFIRYVEKKFFYIIRKFGMISKGDIILYDNKKSFRDVVLESLLKMFEKRAPVEIVKFKSKKRFTKKAVPSTIDNIADKMIYGLFKKENENFKNLKPVEGNIIKPLYLFLDKEILLYAKLKNLKFEALKEKKNKISLFLENLEEKHPEIKRAIVNSYLELYWTNL